MELPAFVKAIQAEKRWERGTPNFTFKDPQWTVTFTIAPYYDERFNGEPIEGQVTKSQQLEVVYDNPPPFVAGELVALNIADGPTQSIRQTIDEKAA
jgi:hypothetical protein